MKREGKDSWDLMKQLENFPRIVLLLAMRFGMTIEQLRQLKEIAESFPSWKEKKDEKEEKKGGINYEDRSK